MLIPLRTDGILSKILTWLDDRHVFVILPIIGILSSAGAFVWVGQRTMPEPEPISRGAEKGDYCYLDVQYLTTWVLSVKDGGDETRYYLAADASRSYFVVSMSEFRFSQLESIAEFTETPNAADPPEPQRAAGIVKSLPAEDLEALSEALGLTEQAYRETFGSTFVDLTENPNTVLVGVWMWVLWLSLLVLSFEGLAALDEFTERRKRKKGGSIG